MNAPHRPRPAADAPESVGRPRTRRGRAVLGGIALAGALVLAGCTGDDDAAEPAASAAPATTAPTANPGSPFCAGIAEITTTLDGDPPDDLGVYLIGAYKDLLPVTPPEVAPDLEALIAALSRPASASPGATTPASTPATGTAAAAPDDVAPPLIVVTPGERVAEYVAEHCGRTDANPGPAATPPAGGYDTVADTAPPTVPATSAN